MLCQLSYGGLLSIRAPRRAPEPNADSSVSDPSSTKRLLDRVAHPASQRPERTAFCDAGSRYPPWEMMCAIFRSATAVIVSVGFDAPAEPGIIAPSLT